MFNEKLIMSSCNERYILVDKSKFSDKLCTNFPIPVECIQDSLYYVKENLLKLGATDINLRLALKKDGPVITESGNFIVDVMFKDISETLEKQIKCITGVIESGLFINYNVEIIS